MDFRYAEEWIEANYNNKRSVYQVRSWLKKFFDFIDVDPEEYINSDRDFDTDYKRYNNYLKKTMAPTSIGNRLSIVKEFLLDHDVQLKHQTIKKIKRQKIREGTISKERIPTVVELQQILMNGDARDRAFFFTLLSSGLRPMELVHLTIDDFDLTHNPPIISVPFKFDNGEYTKTKTSRITFCSNEAKKALEAWLKIRPQKIVESALKSHFNRAHYEKMGYSFEKSDVRWVIKKDGIEISQNQFAEQNTRMFPFTYLTARLMWERLLRKANLDEKDPTTNRYILHLYVLRKFFNTQLKNIIKPYFVEIMLGHTTPYDKPSIETLSAEYLKGIRSLHIYEVEANREELNAMSNQIKIMQKQMAELLRKQESFKHHYVDDYGVPIQIDDDELVRQYEQRKSDDDFIKQYGLEAWRKQQKNK